jgi:hypothetical protein
MAEGFPEDKYDYKPATNMRSFAERLTHAAAANYFFTNSALAQKLPGDEDPASSKFKDKAAVVAYIEKSFADGASAIPSKGDKGISDLVWIASATTIRSTLSKFRFDSAIWRTI